MMGLIYILSILDIMLSPSDYDNCAAEEDPSSTVSDDVECAPMSIHSNKEAVNLVLSQRRAIDRWEAENFLQANKSCW